MLLFKARKNVFQTQVYVPRDQNKQYVPRGWTIHVAVYRSNIIQLAYIFASTVIIFDFDNSIKWLTIYF